MSGKNFVSVVGFQGERGSYSEECISRFFGVKATPRAFRTLADLFIALEDDEIKQALVPIENSIEGSVTEAYDLLLKSSANVNAEMNLRIVHCLISHQSVKKDQIRYVYSHPQALGQCRNYLRRFGREIISTYDTAGSAKMVKEKGMMDAAAIASKRAAEVYGMQVLEEGIEDEENNFTRFFLLSKSESSSTGNDKTSIIFSASHKPGSLYEALSEFAKMEINLTKIESRPTRRKAWEYNFYLDFEGHKEDDRCNQVLETLSKKGNFLKILGSYPKAKSKI